jgi:hypothetical protein
MERCAEAKEALDRLAEGQSQCRCDVAVLGGRARSLFEMVSRRFGLRRIEVLEEARGQDMAALPEEEALLVAEGEDPGQLRGCLAARPSVRPRDPALVLRHRSTDGAIDPPGGVARAPYARTVGGHRAS